MEHSLCKMLVRTVREEWVQDMETMLRDDTGLLIVIEGGHGVGKSKLLSGVIEAGAELGIRFVVSVTLKQFVGVWLCWIEGQCCLRNKGNR